MCAAEAAATDSITICADYLTLTDVCGWLSSKLRICSPLCQANWNEPDGKDSETWYIIYHTIGSILFQPDDIFHSSDHQSLSIGCCCCCYHIQTIVLITSRLKNWLTEKWCFENPRDNTKYCISVLNLRVTLNVLRNELSRVLALSATLQSSAKLLQPTKASDDAMSSWRSCIMFSFLWRPHAKKTHNTPLSAVEQATNTHNIWQGHLENGHKEQVTRKLSDGNIKTDIMELDMTNGHNWIKRPTPTPSWESGRYV